MEAPKSVLLLFHARDTRAEQTAYIAWSLADLWRAWGLRVHVAKGVRGLPEADLALPQVDLTVTPAAYRRALERYPVVLNRRVVDISKRALSRSLVRSGDGWEGPVIVKTDRNCGGAPERRLLGRWTRGTRLDSSSYPIYESVRDVPEGIVRDRSLVVERFLPEREGDLYCLRLWTFLGDRHASSRLFATSPVVKAGTIVRREAVPVPEALVATRRRLGFDYGKFDYVMHEGAPLLLDANRTPTFAGPMDAGRRERAATLAAGLAAFLELPLLAPRLREGVHE